MDTVDMRLAEWRHHVEAAVRVRTVEAGSALGGIVRSAAGGRILLCFGVTGQLNLGDDLLALLARQSIPDRHLVFLTRVSLLQRDLRRRSRATGDAMLVGGGTLLLSEALRRVLEPMVDSGISFATFGSGAHDSEYWGVLTEDERASWSRMLTHAIALGVRGPRTKAALVELGATGAEVVGDPAVLYTRASYRAPTSGRILGVNFGTALGHVWGGDETAPAVALGEALRRLRADGWRIRFFCVWPRDLRIIRQLAALAGIPDPEVIVEFRDPKRFLREVETCRVFVGMKLHAAILAICAGVPTLALEYQPKHRDYMAAIESESEVVRIDRLEGPALAEAVNDLSDRAAEVSERQWESSRNLAETFRGYLSRLRGVLSSSSAVGPR